MPAAPDARGPAGGPTLCDLQARSFGSGSGSAGSAPGVADVAPANVSSRGTQLSGDEVAAYAAATWVYETQWQAASSQSLAEAVAADTRRDKSPQPYQAWTISSDSASHVLRSRSSSGSTAASSLPAGAATAVAELVRVLQQSQLGQGSAPRAVTLSTTGAMGASLCQSLDGSHATAVGRGVAGGSLWGALRTAALEDAALQTAAHDVAAESVLQAAEVYPDGPLATSCRAAAVYLPR